VIDAGIRTGQTWLHGIIQVSGRRHEVKDKVHSASERKNQSSQEHLWVTTNGRSEAISVASGKKDTATGQNL
jgi:hypothetical protein